MATTFLQLTNRVLQTIGEDEIDSTATEIVDPYQKLVATYVNQIKEEVEDAHNWRKLIQTVTVTILAGAETATITGTNERSRLYRDGSNYARGHVPLVTDVTTAGQEYALREGNLANMLNKGLRNTTQDSDFSTEFCIDDRSGDELDLRVYPPALTDRTYVVTLIVPQNRIGFDETSTVISIPTRPIELGAVWYCLEERGEELGVGAVFSEKKYRMALDDAITRDATESGQNTQLVLD